MQVLSGVSSVFGAATSIARTILGGNDSFAIGWGRNAEGQVGDDKKQDHFVPAALSTFKEIVVLAIACGERHTVLIATKVSFNGDPS